MIWSTLIDSTEENFSKNQEGLYEQICRKLEHIAEILMDSGKLEQSYKHPGLMEGRTGVAMFFFYYSTLTQNQEHLDHAFDLLSGIIEQGAELDIVDGQASFSAGLPGIGWAVEHLAQNRFLNADTDDILEDLDHPLFGHMLQHLQSSHYDFLNGALGYYLYFLNRRKLSRLQPHFNMYLAQLVDRLEKMSQPDQNGGLKWESIKNYTTGETGFGISLSHGIASIIAILARILPLETIESHTREAANSLLVGAVTYLLNQRLDIENNDYFSRFPRWSLESAPPASSRLAWCYGDLGIAIALWHASQVTRNERWKKIALDVFGHAAFRRDLEQNRVIDAGVCHGAAGIAHIFNRIYHYAGQPHFKTAAVYWLNKSLEMARYENGYAGFKVRYNEESGGLINKAGLLEGIAGIGLVYISIISGIEPKWDQCLLLS